MKKLLIFLYFICCGYSLQGSEPELPDSPENELYDLPPNNLRHQTNSEPSQPSSTQASRERKGEEPSADDLIYDSFNDNLSNRILTKLEDVGCESPNERRTLYETFTRRPGVRTLRENMAACKNQRPLEYHSHQVELHSLADQFVQQQEKRLNPKPKPAEQPKPPEKQSSPLEQKQLSGEIPHQNARIKIPRDIRCSGAEFSENKASTSFSLYASHWNKLPSLWQWGVGGYWGATNRTIAHNDVERAVRCFARRTTVWHMLTAGALLTTAAAITFESLGSDWVAPVTDIGFTTTVASIAGALISWYRLKEARSMLRATVNNRTMIHKIPCSRQTMIEAYMHSQKLPDEQHHQVPITVPQDCTHNMRPEEATWEQSYNRIMRPQEQHQDPSEHSPRLEMASLTRVERFWNWVGQWTNG